MYDLIDVQTLFESSDALSKLKELCNNASIDYTATKELIKINDTYFLPLHSYIVVINKSNPVKYLSINNVNHVDKLYHILVTLNEGQDTNVQE